jgi:hypothetical protein
MSRISELREKYKPKQGIKYLLIAESPPDCGGEESYIQRLGAHRIG